MDKQSQKILAHLLSILKFFLNTFWGCVESSHPVTHSEVIYVNSLKVNTFGFNHLQFYINK